MSPEDPKALARPREPSFERTPISILLLEDNPADASLELQMLKASGLQVTSDIVRTSPAFMEAVRSKSYEVILCDYSLPGWNGLDALRWLRSSGFKMPFIYVSGTLGEDVAVECIKEGATDYVVKGNLERLPHAVRRALQEENLRLEKDRAEIETHRSEERYRLLFESNPQPMWVFHLATLQFLAVNEAAIDQYEFSRSEFLSMTLRDIRPPEDIPALESSIWKYPSYPEKSQIWRHRTKYGRIIYVEITSRNIEFEGRAASLALAADITNRLKAEDALKRSEAEYRSIVQGAPYGIYRVNNEGQVLMANPALVTMLGCGSEAEVLQLNTIDRPYWDPAELRAAVSTGQLLRHHEAKWKRKDGKPITVRLAGRELSGGVGVSSEYEVFVEDITERKRAEHLLRESEENYRTLFDSMDEGFCTIEVLFDENNRPVDYRFLDVNPAFEKQTGIKNARGRRMREIAPKHEEHWFATYGKIALTGEPARFENIASQLHRCYDVHAFRVGEPRERKVAIFFSDITERKRTDQALRDSEARLNEAQHSAHIGSWQYQPDGTFILSDEMYELYKLPRDAPPRYETLLSAVHSEDQVRDAEAFRKSLQAGAQDFQHESRVVWPDGQIRNMFSLGKVRRDHEGRVIEVVVTTQDVTERKEAEDALRKSEERFSKAFRNSPLAITISTEADGRYVDVNDAFLELLGYKREDIIGRTAAELRFWSEPSDRIEMLRQLKELEKVAKHHTRYRTTKGEIREAEVWAESIELDGQPCVLAITRDVTEIRQLEAQFRQAQKMEAVGQLAGGVAHDFNNLLMIIASYARLIPENIDNRNKIERYAMQIDEAVSRAAAVTQQLLAFSRKQVLQPAVLNLNTLVLGLGKMLPRLLGEDVVMSLAPEATCNVRADATQLEQVIMNLAVNARDAMPSGGKLIIETSDIYLDGRYHTHQGTTIPAGDYVMLAVSDTGTGMDLETQSHIFEPFFTTKGNTGTGLGLATVYGIVKQSGGFIWLYSELGKGTTFKVYLPKVEGAEDRAIRGITSEPDPRGTETILLAEDEAALRTVIDIYLESLGYTVLTSGNGQEALEKLRSNSQSIDLLITDVIMPGIGGPQLAKIAQEMRPGVPVIYISGYPDRALDRSTLGESAAFLQKPFSLGPLAMKIREILGNQS
jgi:two-component system cell cycle sensor histidine kinase/response regulator CckA